MKLEDIGFYTLENARAKNVSSKSPLWRCELLITSKCNFRCPYCRGTNKDADISFEYAKKIIDMWTDDGLRNVRFSGGEPTCIEWLPQLVSYTSSKPSIKRIAISTNGSKDVNYYLDLHDRGVSDFSISLDACCAGFGDKMAGISGAWEKTVKAIKALSQITYVTVGCVFDKANVSQSLSTIRFAHSLGVSDIRIISSAQFNKALKNLGQLPDDILNQHPILKYRVNNYLNGRNVRGINKLDSKRCYLTIDDSAIKGEYHYPCIIYLREGGKPIGKVGKSMRTDRIIWSKTHNCKRDRICKENCLDVCVDYNNEVEKKILGRLKKTNERRCNAI